MDERVGGTSVQERDRRAIDTAPELTPAGGGPGRRSLIVGIRDLAFHQEVLDFLERDSRVEIVSAVDEAPALARVLGEREADAVVVCPLMAREIRHPSVIGRSLALMVVTEEMTVPVLRDAIDAGARGVFAWPDERAHLVDVVTTTDRGEAGHETPRGEVIAVLGARGGAGATFVASHVAAAVADRSARAVVVDLDTTFAGLTVSLGIAPDARVHTLADLVPVLQELSPDHLADALFGHPRGFSALLAPPAAQLSDPISPGLIRASVALLATDHDVVLLHVPRALDAVALAGVRMADQVLLVTTQDLFSLYGAKRVISQLELDRPPRGCRVVVNRLSKAHLALADIGRILGMAPWAVVKFDPAVRRAQDLGRLLPARSRRAGKDVHAMARRLMPATLVSGVSGGSPSNGTSGEEA